MFMTVKNTDMHGYILLALIGRSSLVLHGFEIEWIYSNAENFFFLQIDV